MRLVKPTAVLAAFIFLLSCNQQNSKNSEVKEVALDEVTAETKQIDKKNIIDDETKAVDEKKDFLKTDPPGNKAPQQKKDDGKQKKEPGADQSVKADWDKKIIKTASVNLEVKDYNSYYTSLREKVKNMGGYIAQEEQTQSDYKIENSMTIKVPVDQFDNAVAVLSANVQKINERKISSQDVTMEVVDTKSRMEAKKQVRQRYMDLLGQAKNMEDILNVQSEINGIQEEIESAAGRIEYLSHSSAFSTINLTYYQIVNSSAKENEELKKPSFGERLKDGFRMGWEIVSNLFIVIVTIWPLFLASLLLFILYKKMKTQKTIKP
jgi:hypothetical protein